MQTQGNQVTGKSYKLLLFAAGYCEPCKKELPEIQEWHDKLDVKAREKIKPSVYFIAGNPAIKPATQEDADRFRKDLGLGFPIFADKRAKFYKTFYPSSTQVPATVITNEKDEVVKIFRPGTVSPEEIESVMRR